MTAITLSGYQTAVRRNCRNMKTTHKVYTDSNNLVDPINEAGNGVLLMSLIDPATKRRRDNFELHPKLRGWRWTDITIANQAWVGMPENCLVPESIKYTGLTSTYNESTDRELIITEDDPETIALLDKTTTGFPSLWARQADKLLLWPPPTTDYLTTFIVRGWRKERSLSAPTDTFTMDDLWHPAVADLATHLTMLMLGWYDDAAQYLSSCERKIGDAVSLLGASRRRRHGRFLIAGLGR